MNTTHNVAVAMTIASAYYYQIESTTRCSSMVRFTISHSPTGVPLVNNSR